MGDAVQDRREGTAFTVPRAFSGSDEERRRGLRRMRQVALALLALAAVVYVLTRGREGWLGFVNAGSEAAMVGAIADWFAVTALFRHPLGVPIPHTALIPKRKDTLGASLQEFVADNFLSEPVVRERIHAAQVSLRVGSWLGDPAHRRRVVEEASYVLREGVLRVKDDDVAALVEEVLIPRLKAEPLSPAAGQMLQEVVRDGAHHGLVDLAVAELHRWLLENEDAVELLVAARAPWWTPQWFDERVADRLYREAVAWVADIAGNPDHHARRAFDEFALQLAEDLQSDPETQQRAERLKERVLSRPQVAHTSVALWTSLKRALADSLADPEGLLRRRGLEELGALADRVVAEPELRRRLDEILSDAAAFVVNNYGNEVATIISETVNRWDGKEAARRIELHVGRDLQFIRINGTVVGGLAGVVIHALSLLL